ncbi:MAG: DUF4271 domain-containing protein [Bacteroidales bacterium]|nr:DUF4271 domain-containing protein [Bacteroidales bacterium]
MTSDVLTIQPAPLVSFQPEWIFWVFLGMFLLLAWVQVFDAHRFRMILSATFATRHLHHLMRGGNLMNERISIALPLIYVLSVSMVIYQALLLIFHRTSSAISQLQLFLLLSLAVTGFWACKILIMNFLSIIFKTDQTNSEYKLNILVTVSFLGLLLLPLLIFAVYLKSVWLIYIALGLIACFSIFRLVKGFLIGISLTRFSYFFLFIYLCTLEILPLLVAAKLILDYY